MNKFEFENVIDVLGINNKVPNQTDNYTSIRDIYDWNDFEIYFDDNRYSIIKGKIPFEVAQKIYDKYPNNPHSIRIAGGDLDNKPSEWAKNDEYDKFISTIFESFENDNNYSDTLEQIIKNMRLETLTKFQNQFYIDTYYIDTKEGLLILLTELQDYYIQRILNNPEVSIQVAKQPELMAEVNRRLIKQSNPYLNTDQWIKKQNAIILEETKNYQSNDKQDLEIRELLNEFDETINPFINDKFDMLDPSNYIDNISFSWDTDNNKTQFTILDNKTKFESKYTRDNNRLLYNFYYGKGLFISISHQYINENNESFEPIPSEEVIYIYHNSYQHNKEKNIDIRYNLTNKSYIQENQIKPITPEQKTFIIEELKKAIQVAKRTTINNMCVPKEPNNMRKILK